jgi:hypothetical protein
MACSSIEVDQETAGDIITVSMFLIINRLATDGKKTNPKKSLQQNTFRLANYI